MTGYSGGSTIPVLGAGVADTAGSQLASPLILLAATELLLLRTFTRVAIHIPGLEHTAGPYRLASEAGRLAYYLAVVVLVLLLVERIAAGLRESALPHAATAALTVFVAGAVAARAGIVGDAVLALLVAGALALLLPAARGDLSIRRAWPVYALGSALLVAILHSLLGGGHALAGSGDVTWLLLIAEALAVAGAIAAPLTVRGGPDKLAFGIAVTVAILGGAALLQAGATVRILLLWNFGLAGYFPGPLYAVAAGALVYAILATRKRDRLLSWGLALLILGGFALQSTYQTGLFLAGLAMLASRSRSRAPTPAHERAQGLGLLDRL